MGNTPPTPSSLRLGNGDPSYKVELGRSAGINFRGRKVKQYGDGLIVESWELSYRVGKSTFIVTLESRKNHDSSSLDIEIYDDGSFGVDAITLKKAERGLFSHNMVQIFINSLFLPDDKDSFQSSTTNAWGGITDTIFHFYGHGTRLSLIFGEFKRRSKDDENPYSGMVAHYYANTENGEDVGLSVVLKRIGMSDDGHLDFSVDGPEQHPVAALHYMFNEIRRTRTWKPTYCPHCADKIIHQRQRADICESGSTDSDVDNVPAALLPSRGQNARGLLANDGRFKGNNNDEFIIASLQEPPSAKM